MAFAVWGVAAPTTLKPLYIGWMSFALLLNKITTPIVLGVVFYLVISPMALVMRSLKKDPIPKGFEESKNSYRLKSSETGRESFERPF